MDEKGTQRCLNVMTIFPKLVPSVEFMVDIFWATKSAGMADFVCLLGKWLILCQKIKYAYVFYPIKFYFSLKIS